MSATSKLAGATMTALLECSVLFPVNAVEVLARIVTETSEGAAGGKCNTIEPQLDCRCLSGQQGRQLLHYAVEVGRGERHIAAQPQGQKIRLRTQAIEFHRPTEHARAGYLG